MNESVFYCDKDNLTETEKKFYIFSCGSYKYKENCTPREIERKTGNDNYQLFFVLSGKSDCIINGTAYTLSSGKAVFLTKNSPHYYKHLPTPEGTEIYSVHFDGELADSFIKECGFTESCVFSYKTNIRTYFENIINELMYKEVHHEKKCTASLYSLIVMLSRELIPGKIYDEAIENIMRIMHDKHYSKNTLEDFAALCSLSVPQFIRRFTAVTGTTPMKYKTECTIKAAISLLENSKRSIGEIAEMLGYENSYYFSNQFKKHTGVSPKSYRLNTTNKKL